MIIKRLGPYFVFFFVFFLTGCETQIGTAIKHAGMNLINGNVFKHAFTSSAYEELKEQTKKDRTADTTDIMTCTEAPQIEVLPFNTLSNLEQIKDQMCSCKAWGSCDNSSCSCESLCPNNFEILNRSTALSDDPRDSLSFINTAEGYNSVGDSSYQGYCWGHAVLTQRFNRLATFNPNKPSPYEGIEHEDKRIEEYKKIIEKLNNNEPVDIDGFADLREFSSHPEVETLLKDSVKSIWGENAMSIQGMKMVSGSSPMEKTDFQKMISDVEERLSNHQAPSIVFNEVDNAKNSHVTIISGVKTNPDGTKELCIRDNNFHAYYVADCQATIKQDPDGSINYHLPKVGRIKKMPIGKATIVHNEDSDVVAQVRNLQKKCALEKGCSN